MSCKHLQLIQGSQHESHLHSPAYVSSRRICIEWLSDASCMTAWINMSTLLDSTDDQALRFVAGAPSSESKTAPAAPPFHQQPERLFTITSARHNSAPGGHARLCTLPISTVLQSMADCALPAVHYGVAFTSSHSASAKAPAQALTEKALIC